MENAILVALSRQIALQRKMEITANNMANVNTAGYKADSLKFEEYISPIARERGFEGRDRRVSFVRNPMMVRDYGQGQLRQTGRPLDIALSGDGWLVVKTPRGERYTRNGQLHLNNDGILVSNEGYPVLGENGEISFAGGESDIVIGRDGSIAGRDGIRDRLRLVEFSAPQALKKEGSSLYNSAESPSPAQKTSVIQGSYESSNVSAMKELTQMIETVRAYSSVSQMLKANDESRGKAIEQLGRPAL